MSGMEETDVLAVEELRDKLAMEFVKCALAEHGTPDDAGMGWLARKAYAFADAMLAERVKQPICHSADDFGWDPETHTVISKKERAGLETARDVARYAVTFLSEGDFGDMREVFCAYQKIAMQEDDEQMDVIAKGRA